MPSIAYYRLPYADSYTCIESQCQPLVLHDIAEINQQAGFVIVPFQQCPETPALLIPANAGTLITHSPLPARSTRSRTAATAATADHTSTVTETSSSAAPSPAYADAFAAFHGAVSDGTFRKLVLARKHTLSIPDGISPKQAFLHACAMYPRLMIILFSTPITGTWLIASPEILLESTADTYHTVALAGTMPYQEGYLDWSTKNKEEQHIVEEYIMDALTPFSNDILKDGPVTMRAGNLAHLRTDFRFHLLPGQSMGSILKHLHPTPAVCGLPKSEAKQFIHVHESLNRSYYSGFSGPVNINNETHLYVSLRCAQLHDTSITLYAGGGIMPDSQCLSEWTETETKMQTIANVFQ